MEERTSWITSSPDGKAKRSETVTPPKMHLSGKLGQAAREKKVTEAEFSFSGKVIHPRRGLTSFDLLKIPTNVREIDVSGNKIKSFDGLANLQYLETLNIANNNITSFARFPHLPRLTSITITGNPVARNEYHRTALLLLCRSLKVINGEIVRPNEWNITKLYPADCPFLLRSGWKICYPPPKETDIPGIRRGFVEASPKRSPVKAATSPRPTGTPKKQSEVYENQLIQTELELHAVKRQYHKLAGY